MEQNYIGRVIFPGMKLGKLIAHELGCCESALRSGNIVNNEGHTELRLLLVENFNQYPDLLAWNIAGNVNFWRFFRAISLERKQIEILNKRFLSKTRLPVVEINKLNVK